MTITKKNKIRKKKKYTKKRHLLKNIHKDVSHDKYKSFEEDNKDILSNNKTILAIERDISKTLKSLFSPKSIKPQDDFYTYINYQWLKDVERKNLLHNKFYTQYDNFRITQEKVYYDLVEIIQEYIKNNNNNLSRQINNVYSSSINGDDNYVDKHIKITIDIIDKFIENDDLYGLLAYVNRNEMISIASPIRWSVLPDLYEPTKYTNYINIAQLPFYDFDLYFDNENDSIGRKQYKTYFRNVYYIYVFDLFKYINNKFGIKLDSNQLYIIGHEIAKCITDSYLEKNPSNLIINKDECLKKYGFDWDAFAKKIGYKKTPDNFIVSNPNYLKLVMDKVTKNWKNWREWWIYINVKQQIRFSKKLYPIYFKFYRKYVQGAEFKVPKVISPIFLMSLCFDTFLSNEYIKKYGIKENIDYTQNMANDLKFIFMRILKNNNWLTKKTKDYAIKKIDKIDMVIGASKRHIDDPNIKYSDKDVWNNVEKIYEWRLKKFIELNGKHVIDMPQVDWSELKLSGRQCYIVNAFYTPHKNDIYIPLAYLQKPFLDLSERGIEYNLAYLGFTIAHELSHSLDDLGRKYSYDGKLHSWWTKKDEERYEKKIKNIIEQYNIVSRNDNINFNAEPSIGEDIADITGLAICEQYLIDFQIKNENIIPIKILSMQAFFTYYAIQMRQSIAKKAYKAQLVVNPHPPDKYRVNIPLSRLKIFRDTYNVKRGDKMYWNSIDTIW